MAEAITFCSFEIAIQPESMKIQKKDSDETLLTQIKSGEKQAFEILFDRYFESLCDFSYQFLKSKDLSEEAVSDVFIKVWLNKTKLQIKSGVKAYLYRAVRNQSLNYIKKEGDLFEDLSELYQQPADNLLSADRSILYDELQKNVDSLIDEMPSQRKLIFRMNRLDGMKYQEIAEVLGISVYTVQNHMVEASKHLSSKYSQLKSMKMWAIFIIIFLLV